MVKHSKVWDRKDDPKPGPTPPWCEYCSRKYAIKMRHGRHVTILCGQCIGQMLAGYRQGHVKRKGVSQ